MTQRPVIFNLFDHDALKNMICASLDYESGHLRIHKFPDKEIMITIDTPIQGRNVFFIASTDKPNEKLAPLIFAAETARALGARRVGLIAPYLAYMRQDKQFHPGEGITSKYFAKIISAYFDYLLTIDPHLHRWHSLDQLFSIPTTVLHATSAIAAWVKQHNHCPLLIGPDQESYQWIAAIAAELDAAFLMVEKQRFSDTLVKASIPNIASYPGHIPIIIDDIISTAKTMIETIHHLKLQGMSSIQAIGVHAIFSAAAYSDLLATGIAETEIATCNTIHHLSNKIDVSALIINALAQFEMK